MKTLSLKQAVKAVFPTATNIEEKTGYNMRTVWFDMDNKVYYLHTDKVGWQSENDVYYREAEHRRDYTGKGNQWGFMRKLSDMDCKLYIVPKNCDFNRG